jgi:hypothetical protein
MYLSHFQTLINVFFLIIYFLKNITISSFSVSPSGYGRSLSSDFYECAIVYILTWVQN